MACDADGHAFAPAVLLRAAAFPIDALDGFGDPALAALASSATGGPPHEELVAAYDAAMERETRLLRQLTVGDEAFLKALVIANPQLARAAVDAPGRRTRKAAARARRLRGALYRHLARAVGRTEPADLWSGVALAEWSERTRVRPQPRTVLVQPDLRPFQSVLRVLATRPPYLWSEHWRANATLARQPDGRWRYASRLRDGRVVDRSVEPNAALDLVVPLLPGGGLRLDEVASRLAAHLGIDPRTVARELEAYVDAGLLVGGLDLPTRFATAWEALDRAGDRLVGADREAWQGTVDALRGCAGELEAQLDAMTSSSVAEVVEDATTAVRDLAQRLGVTIEPPRTVLRCDLALGFRVTLGPDVRTSLAVALREHEAPGGPATAGSDLRAELAGRVSSHVGPARPLAEAALDFRSPRAGDRVVDAVPGGALARGPVGCLLVGLDASSGDGPSLRVRGVFDEVAPLYGRFAPLWAHGDRGPRDALYPWLRDRLDGLGEACRLRVVELAGPCEANPNALAAPSFADDVVELWGTTERAQGLVGAELRTDPVTGAPVLRLPGQPADVVLFSFSSADLARDDRVSELLLATSGRIAPAASFEAAAAPSSGDHREPEPTPAGDGHVGGAGRPLRRTLLAESAAEELRAGTGVQRYVCWQQLATRHGWSATVRVRVSPGEPPLLVRTSSPLAVESVLGRVPEGASHVVVEDADHLPWLADGTGARYVSELAVPFSRETHLWSARGALGSVAVVGGRP